MAARRGPFKGIGGSPFDDTGIIVWSQARAANLKSRLGVFETTKKRIFSFFGVLPDLNFLTIL